MAPSRSTTAVVLDAVQRATRLFRDVPAFDPAASANAQRPYRQLVRAIAELQGVADEKNCPALQELQPGRSVTSTPAPSASRASVPRASVPRASVPAPTPTLSQPPKLGKRSADVARLSDEEPESEEEVDVVPSPKVHQIGAPSRRSARTAAKATDASASVIVQGKSAKKTRTKAPASAIDLQRREHEGKAIEITRKIVRGVYDDPMEPREFFNCVYAFYNGTGSRASKAMEREMLGVRRAHAGVAYADAHAWAHEFRTGRVDVNTLPSNFANLLLADDTEDNYRALVIVNKVRIQSQSLGPVVLYAYAILGKMAEIKVAQVWAKLGPMDRGRHYSQRFYNVHRADWFEGMSVQEARPKMENEHRQEFKEMRGRINREYAACAALRNLFLQFGPAVLLFPEFEVQDVRGSVAARPALTLAYSLLKTSQPRDVTEDEMRDAPDAHALSILQLNAQHALLSILTSVAGDRVADYVARFLESMRDDLHAAIPPYPYKAGLFTVE